MNLDNLFVEIEENLSASYQVYAKNNLDEGEGVLRSEQEAKAILKTFEYIALKARELIADHPALESLFEKQYGKFNYVFSREHIVDTCFLGDYIFYDKEEFPLPDDMVVTDEILVNYQASFYDWVKDKKSKHIDTQDLVLNRIDLETKQSNLTCSCLKCVADYRAKIRDYAYELQKKLIDDSLLQLEELIVEEKISYISDYVSKLKKRMERNTAQVRFRLKRASLNKLDQDVKSYFKAYLGSQSELGIVYKQRLISFFTGILTDQGNNADLITDNEYERFFTQIGIGIWKAPHSLQREFEKLVKSVLAFKRKDISATILRDYLGQFWIHSEARRKTRKIIYHMGPTNSGKTYNAIEALSKADNGCYLAPLRLLASELYDTLNTKGCKTTLLTGEEVVETAGATHFSSTIEMAKLNQEFECVVIDEIQMITDTQRGWAWTRALVNVNANEVHLCGDHSVLDLVKKILELTGDTLEINEYERKTTLTVMDRPIKLVDLEKNDALIVFSRRNALKYKRDLENLNFKVSIVYGRLSPEVRREQARKFDEGETDIMVSTDAIAMGMNLPVKRIVFSAVAKFWDSKEFPLSDSEIKQIAGRAGRYKLFPEGFVTTLQKVEDGVETVRTAINHKLEQKTLAMVGPDLDIFRSVNMALEESNLKTLSLSEFLRLFNTMSFEKPFYCVDLKEMIELAETVEEADSMDVLSDSEIFGFACAPVNQGLLEHVQYYVWILNHYVGSKSILNEDIDAESDDIDYLETAIKCVELYQWLARHFDNNNFMFEEDKLLYNKTKAIERLNELLSAKTTKKCSSCGCKLDDESKFNICETCFSQGRSIRHPSRGGPRDRKAGSGSGGGGNRRGGSSGGKKKFSKKKDSNRSSEPKRSSSSKKSKKPKNKAAAFLKG